MEKINLFGLTLSQLQTLCQEQGFPKFTAKQMADWLYAKRVLTIDEMTNLSLKVRSQLNDIAYIGRHFPIDCQTSKDGTKKYLFRVTDADEAPQHVPHQYVESVFIPDGDRGTLCISCQRGCKMGCKFCVTGQQGFHGSLSAGEILNQIFSIPEFDLLTNIVYMGMGEPMDNYDAVSRAIEVLTADWGFGWSPKRITVSTIGVIPALQKFLDGQRCHLAVSLHNPFPDERLQFMPVQKGYPIKDVISLIRQYDWTAQRRVSFEYTMFAGFNDDKRHADALIRMLSGLECRVNLIRFHRIPDFPYECATDFAMQAFRDRLNAHGVTCTIRASRGEDILAACGMLAGKHSERQ